MKFGILVACLSATVTAQGETTPRVTAGLQVLYDFEGKGEVIADRAETGTPLDLKISDPGAVQRGAGKLVVKQPVTIASQRPASRLVQAVKQSGELTIETWVVPSTEDQSGPARIVTLSKDASERNFTLGQEGSAIDVRFRTRESNGNGLPSLTSSKGAIQPRQLMHVVYTRSRDGHARLYINGKPAGRARQGGALRNWNGNFKLGLANEVTGGRLWKGTYHLVALYARALGTREVQQNFRAGADAQNSHDNQWVSTQTRNIERFETQITTLLSQHCLECHDAASAEGGLDLSRKGPALAGGESGRAIVPGKPAESLLWQRVEDDSMPQDRPPLSKQEKERLQKWIADGADWTIDFVDPAIYRSVREGENWIQRLTTAEYIESVRAAVGVDISKQARDLLPQDKRADGFRNTAYNLNVDLKHVEAYAQLAEIIVSRMDPVKFASQFRKSRELTDDNMRALIGEMGKWILRGPLRDDEVVIYRGISTTVASAGGDFREAVAMVLEAMLQSPRFLYRIENQVGDGNRWPVDEYELAARISYTLWGAPPDQPLLAEAEAGRLSDPEVVDQQVTRMLQDPRAKARSRDFVSQWLNLDRLDNMNPNSDRFPDWDRSLASDMREETIAFFQDVVWQQQRPLTDLLNAQFTYASPELARHYGMKPQGKGFRKYDLSEVPSRGGLLTHGSVLTIGGDDASMVTRGLFVLNDLLFSEVGDPPPGLDTTPVPTRPGKTHRAIAMERVESDSCGGCHSRFEPLAFGLEKFDGLGSFHEQDEHGNKLREDGEILFPGHASPIQYQTSAEMMDLLAGSDRVAQCLTRKLVQFSLGRPLIAADAKLVQAIHERSQQRGGTYTSILRELIHSDLIQTTRTEPVP